MALTIDDYQQFVLDTVEEFKDATILYANKADDILSTTFWNNSGTNEPLKSLTFLGEDIVADGSKYKDISDLRNEFDTKYHSLIDTLHSKVPNEFASFINTYFPKPSNFDNLEKFLVDSVFNGSIGLPPEVEKQIWQQAKERNDLDLHKNMMENRRSMAARGFREPNGVELFREMIIMNEGSKNNSELSRQIAIDSAKLRVDWVKFAVNEARNYRTLAIEASFKYLLNVLSVNDYSFKYASGYVDSYKTFYDTLNTYQNSVNNINRLKFEKANALTAFTAQNDDMKFKQNLSKDQLKQNTALELVRAMAGNTSAALSAVNTVTSVTSQL